MIGPDGALGLLAARCLGAGARPVRLLFFDKTAQSNWAVPWHQDRTIAVAQRIEIEGYGPWSSKAGIPHVEPPVAVLAGMLALRVFVDDCAEDNGPLEVAKGSHRVGRVAVKDVAGIVRGSEIAVGTGASGDVLLMKGLAIHGSKRAAAPDHRRVLHVDYAGVDLPPGLGWALETG